MGTGLIGLRPGNCPVAFQLGTRPLLTQESLISVSGKSAS